MRRRDFLARSAGYVASHALTPVLFADVSYVLNPLKFGGTNDVINVGSSNTLDASAFMTLLAWLNCTNLTADQRIYVRGAGGSSFFADFGGSPTNLTSFTIPRATTSAQVRVNFSDAPIVTANKPLFVAWVLDTTDDAQCRLFIGDLVTAPKEHTYTTQRAGSGTITANPATSTHIGNRAALARPFVGTMWMVGLWNRCLNYNEIISQWRWPHATNDAAGYWRPGAHGMSGVPDLSGHGNHGAISGPVVTGDTLSLIEPF